MISRIIALLLVGVIVWSPRLIGAQETTDTGVTIHVVQRGETLFRIALHYGLTVEELAGVNGIVDASNILVGQRLLVPIQGAPNAATPQTHLIQPGETLRSIAEFYNLTVEALATRNGIADPNTIFVGQVLKITPDAAPPTAEPPTPIEPLPASAPALIHTVQRGETLFRIAIGYGLTVNDLARANNISDPTLIYAGQQLIIPGFEPPQLALDLPLSVASLDMMPLVLVEGQTGRIRLTTTSAMNVGGMFLGRKVAVMSEQGNTFHTLLIGIPIFTEAGIYPISLNMSDATGQPTDLTVNTQIVSGNYGSEYIRLLADRAGLLDPKVETAEQDLIQMAMSVFTPTRYWDGPMGLPAAAVVISPFGRKRSYNGGPFDRFHSGTDFAGAPGTPILAPAPGYVVVADALNVRGNATIIDHGWGVLTGYWHQSERYVQVGELVATGQVIGTVGATGRVSGPHLHWELWVNGVPVDPMQWVRQSFV